jgi:hypothetical protein
MTKKVFVICRNDGFYFKDDSGFLIRYKKEAKKFASEEEAKETLKNHEPPLKNFNVKEI